MSAWNRKRLTLLGLGVAVGAIVVGVGLSRRGREEPSARPDSSAPQGFKGSGTVDPPRPPRGTSPSAAPAWKTLGDGLRDEWAGWMERRNGGGVEVDADLLRRRLAEVAPGIRVQVGLLAPGIVEVVGTVPGAELSRALRVAAAAEPGVRTVVDRLWVEGDTA